MLPEFRGNRMFALSGSDREGIGQILASVHGWSLAMFEGCALASERPDCFATGGGHAVSFGVPRFFERSSGAAVTPQDLLAIAADRSKTWRLASPANCIIADDQGIVGHADVFGLGALYHTEWRGLSAISNSATLLADLFDLGEDRLALTGFAMTGAFVGTSTAFETVEKLPAGKKITLHGGKRQLSEMLPRASDLASAGGEKPADIFRGAVSSLCAAFPGADLELSGGLDSRLILAAMAPETRTSHRAISIGPENSADVVIARSLAAAFAMPHVILPTDTFDALEAHDLGALLGHILIGYDYAANPIDKAAIVAAGMSDRSTARFGGQNGESFRGFFYPGQPLEAEPDEALARRLVSWRLRANDQVDLKLLQTDGFLGRAAEIEQNLVGRLLNYGGPWYHALDRFYLEERMQRWVGAGSSNRFIDRTSLYPFFDEDVVAAALSLDGFDKKDSAAAYNMLVDIDLDLAKIALDNGIVPSAAVDGRSAPLVGLARKGKKLAEKIARRLLGGSRSTLGSDHLVRRWHDLRLFESLPHEKLKQGGLISPAAVDEIIAGQRRLDRASLGFVILLAGLADRQSRVAR